MTLPFATAMLLASTAAAPPAAIDYTVYTYTGAAETVTVPAGITSVTVWLLGGAGGNGNFDAGAYSGGGGWIEGTFSVTPGDSLKLEVGGGGAGAARNANGGAGGWPDGGGGGKGDAGSGGGGGSTRFYINSVLKAVAGGGGGSGGYSGGGLAGAGGGTSGQSASIANAGTGGTQSAGGVDGNDTGNANKTGRSIVSFPGVQRTGGWGSSTGNSTTTTTDDGGGGGGGYYGGGGGGGDAQSGGGGSSWIDSGAAGTNNRTGNRQTPAAGMPGHPYKGFGKNSGANGSAVSGENGLAVIWWGGATYGRSAVYTRSANYIAAANEKSVFQVTFATAVRIKGFLIEAYTGQSGPLKAIIYSDNSGSPNSLLFTSAEVAADSLPHFIDLPMADTELSAGTYWFGIHNGATVNLLSGEVGSVKGNADTYSDGPSATFGTPSNYGTIPKHVLFYEAI